MAQKLESFEGPATRVNRYRRGLLARVAIGELAGIEAKRGLFKAVDECAMPKCGRMTMLGVRSTRSRTGEAAMPVRLCGACWTRALELDRDAALRAQVKGWFR